MLSDLIVHVDSSGAYVDPVAGPPLNLRADVVKKLGPVRSRLRNTYDAVEDGTLMKPLARRIQNFNRNDVKAQPIPHDRERRAAQRFVLACILAIVASMPSGVRRCRGE